MVEALALVKHHLGPHAVILHTRKYRRGGIMGLGSREVVEVTAADRGEPVRQQRRVPLATPVLAVAPRKIGRAHV